MEKAFGRLHIFCTIMISILLIQGCSQDLPVEDESEVIGFQVETVNTRGSIQSKETLGEFGVLAYYYADGNYDPAVSIPDHIYIHNVRTWKSGADWVYSPLKYWPVEGALSFYAYAPHSEATAGSLIVSDKMKMGAPVLTYTVSDDVASQTDLLASEPLIAMANGESKVRFNFEHVLGRINFDARLSYELPSGQTARIKEIQVGGLKNRGSYDFSSWTLADNASAKTYTLSADNRLLKDIPLTTTSQSVSAENAGLMLIPQVVDEADIVKVTVSFQSDGLVEEKVFERPLQNLLPEIEIGKAYVIRLSITTPTSILITCEVAPWVTHTITLLPFV